MKIQYYKGQRIGSCIFINEEENYVRPSGGKERRAKFKCKCGNEFISHIQSVKCGLTTSCGCVHEKVISAVKTTHGLSHHFLYNVWNNMKGRCTNPNNDAYHNYGGRGIKVCENWVNDFKAYYDYVTSLDKALEPKLTVDRVNNDGNYEPGNLRWATRKEQARNSRRCLGQL